jgi:hypothetical protein
VIAFRWRGAPEHLLSVAGQVTRVNPFLGPSTLETNTPPQSGESGAPLVLASSSEIVGVTSAVDMSFQRGVYSGLEAIYQLLDQCGPANVELEGFEETSSRRLFDPERFALRKDWANMHVPLAAGGCESLFA